MQPSGRGNPLRHGVGVGRIRDITNLEAEFQDLDLGKARAAAATQHPLVITSTGFHGAERKRLAELAQALGGSYAPDLVAGTTSHLVCKRLIDAVGGPKHTAALRWGVKVVSAAWLEDSAAAGRVQPEAAYKDDPPAAWQPSPWQQPSMAHLTVTHSHQQPQPTLQRQHLAPGSSADRAWSAEAGNPDLFMPTAPASSTLAQSAAATASAAPFSFTQLPAAAHSSSPPSWGGLPATRGAPLALTPPVAAATVGTGGGSSHAVGVQAAAASVMYAGRNSSSSSGADHTQHQQQHNQQQRCSSMAAVEDEDVWVPETQADWGQGLEEPELGQLSLGGAAVGTTAASPAQAHGGGVGGVETAEEPQEQAQQQRQPQTVQEEQDQLQHDVAQHQVAELSNPANTAAASAVEAAAAPATQIQPDCKEASSSATTHLTRLRRLRRRAAVPAASPDAPSRCHQAGDSELEDSGCSEAEEDQLEDSSSADEQCEPTSSRQQPQDTAATAGGHQGEQLPRGPHLGGQCTPGQLLTPGCSMSGSSWPGATPASADTTSSSLPITRLSFSGLAAGGGSSSSKDTQRHQQRHQQGVQGGCPSTSASSSGRSRGSAGRSLSLSRTSAALAAAAAARPADIEALRQEQQRQRAARKAAAASAAASGVSQSGAPEVTQQVQEAEHDEHDELEEVVADSDELVDEASSGDQHQAPQQQHMQQEGEGDSLLSPAYHQQQQAAPGSGSGQLPASATSFITKRRCGGGRGGRSGRAGDGTGAVQGPDDQAAHSPTASAAAAATPGVEYTGEEAAAAGGPPAPAAPAGDSCHLPEEDTTTPPTQPGQPQVQRVGTAQAAAGAAVLAAQLGGRLPHLGGGGGAAAEGVLALKLAARPPRGSSAKEHHGLRSSKQLVYAEQVQVPWARTTLSTKERSRCVICQQPPGPGAPAPAPAKPLTTYVAEPVAFYQLAATGEWWMEGHRFYSAKDLRALAGAAGAGEVALPADFHAGCELLRGLQHTHLPLSAVKGEVKLARLRKAPAPGSSKGAGGLYWRYQLDVLTCRVLLEAGRGAGGGGQEASVAGGPEATSTCSTAQGGGC